MSVQSIQNRIASIQRGIDNLHGNLSRKSEQRASKTARIAQISGSVTKHTSASSLRGKQNEMRRLQREIAGIQKEEATLTKRLAEKTASLHKAQQDLYKEQDKEQKKFVESLKRRGRDDRRQQGLAVRSLRAAAASRAADAASSVGSQADYDAFICHASEDKDDLVRPLAEALVSRGHRIWYDEFELKVGASLRRSIDAGLSRSRFGIVVLSQAFLAKEWPQRELDGLVAKEIEGGSVILPIWHKISKDEVLRYSPPLADKLALNTATASVDELADRLSEAMA